MRRTKTRSAILAAALALVLVPTSASGAPREKPTKEAQPTAEAAKEAPPTSTPKKEGPTGSRRATRPRSSETDEGYAYDFTDDPLRADTNGAAAAVIRTRRQGILRTLIRPRLHFIPELLKSVENL